MQLYNKFEEAEVEINYKPKLNWKKDLNFYMKRYPDDTSWFDFDHFYTSLKTINNIDKNQATDSSKYLNSESIQSKSNIASHKIHHLSNKSLGSGTISVPELQNKSRSTPQQIKVTPHSGLPPLSKPTESEEVNQILVKQATNESLVSFSKESSYKDVLKPNESNK